ncbi:MAG: type II toxin-antitoxin system ParD family antitoxin [Saprospiraceae bacterium]
MNVSLTPALEKLVHKKVKSGVYNNASEVIREALRLLEEQDQIKELKLKKLKSELQIGLDQLDGKQFSDETLEAIAKSVKKK